MQLSAKVKVNSVMYGIQPLVWSPPPIPLIKQVPAIPPPMEPRPYRFILANEIEPYVHSFIYENKFITPDEIQPEQTNWTPPTARNNNLGMSGNSEYIAVDYEEGIVVYRFKEGGYKIIAQIEFEEPPQGNNRQFESVAISPDSNYMIVLNNVNFGVSYTDRVAAYKINGDTVTKLPKLNSSHDDMKVSIASFSPSSNFGVYYVGSTQPVYFTISDDGLDIDDSIDLPAISEAYNGFNWYDNDTILALDYGWPNFRILKRDSNNNFYVAVEEDDEANVSYVVDSAICPITNRILIIGDLYPPTYTNPLMIFEWDVEGDAATRIPQQDAVNYSGAAEKTHCFFDDEGNFVMIGVADLTIYERSGIGYQTVANLSGLYEQYMTNEELLMKAASAPIGI